jgi:hypothetical protein
MVEAMSEPTCGQGLAEHSAVPGGAGELMDAMAEMLRVHRTALDPADEDTRPEDAAYARLAEDLAAIADRLRATADAMTGYRDLPMGRHDLRTMMDRDNVATFQRYVQVEEELLRLLRSRLDVDRGMLAVMESRRA